MLHIRPATTHDLPDIAHIFHQSIHELAHRNYSPPQLHAWSECIRPESAWQKRLDPLSVRIATIQKVAAGFIAYTPEGHIDFLYTAPAFARRGVATELLSGAEAVLIYSNVRMVSTEASITALPFFRLMGYRLVCKQTVSRQGVDLRNYRMEKRLSSLNHDPDSHESHVK
jgi:putative acetyltransferase